MEREHYIGILQLGTIIELILICGIIGGLIFALPSLIEIHSADFVYNGNGWASPLGPAFIGTWLAGYSIGLFIWILAYLVDIVNILRNLKKVKLQ